jgi:hypothetical protein
MEHSKKQKNNKTNTLANMSDLFCPARLKFVPGKRYIYIYTHATSLGICGIFAFVRLGTLTVYVNHFFTSIRGSMSRFLCVGATQQRKTTPESQMAPYSLYGALHHGPRG